MTGVERRHWWPCAQVRCPRCGSVGAVAYTDGAEVHLCRSADEISDFYDLRSGLGERVLPSPLVTAHAAPVPRRQREWSPIGVRWCMGQGHTWSLRAADVERMRGSTTVLNVRSRADEMPLDKPTTGR